MNNNLLAKRIFFNNYFYRNSITKPFSDFYFKNKDHKYDIFYTYIFGVDRIIEKLKDIKNIKNSSFFTLYPNNKIDYDFFDSYGQFNFKNEFVKYLIEKLGFLYIFIGEFNYKNSIANLFLNVSNSNYVSGFAIDTGDNDQFFRSYQKYEMFLNSSDIEFSRSIEKEILKYSEMCN